MTVAFTVLVVAGALLVAVLAVSAVLLIRRGMAAYGLLVVCWGTAFVGSDIGYAAVLAHQVSPPVGRRVVLVLTLAMIVAQVLITRVLFPQWMELVLDSGLVSVGAVLIAWTLAIVTLGTGAADSTTAYVVYLTAAAFGLSVTCRQLRTLALPDRVGGRLLIVAATLRCGAIAALLAHRMTTDISQRPRADPLDIALVLVIAASYVLMLAAIHRLRRFAPSQAPLRTTRLTDSLPYVVFGLASVVVLTGLAIEPGLRRLPFVASCMLLAVALCVRQVLITRAYEQLLNRLADRERLYRSLVQDSSDITMVVAPDGRLDYVSPAAQRVLGRSARDLVGRPAADLLGVTDSELAAATQGVMESGTPERVESRPTSEPSVVLESVLSRRDDRVLINARDVSEQAEMRRQLQLLAYTDELTGLANWHRVRESITAELATTGSARALQEPALLFVDLDRFKSVNDAAGHAAGDAVLRVVAERLHAVVPAGAVLGRVGGDEFLVLLPGSVAGRRELVAHDIARVMAEPCETDHGSFSIGASVGIATASGARDADDLLRHADLAMYAAKRDHRAWQGYDPRLHIAAVDRAQRDRAYSTLIDERQLAVVFQPVVELETGTPIACEALLRWRDADGRLGEPSGLLEFAARSGRMYDLSIWVLGTALDEAVRWRKAGASVPVAVNLSSRDVLHPGLAQLIRTELRNRDLPPSALTLEITEQVLMGDPTAAMDVCEELRALGVLVAIDDFGTGFSSLAYLIDLPIDAVKIDQSFIHSLTRGGSATVVVRAIVQMATELGLKVIAEGIETPQHRDLTIAAGVRYGQGYLFASELTGEHLRRLVAARPVASATGPGDAVDRPA